MDFPEIPLPTPEVDLDIKGGVVDAMTPVAYAINDAIELLSLTLMWCFISFFILLGLCILWRTHARIKFINRKN
jgi:hypothetical protein